MKQKGYIRNKKTCFLQVLTCLRAVKPFLKISFLTFGTGVLTPQLLVAQQFNAEDTVLVAEFVKESDSIADGSVHFNVLKLKNVSNDPIEVDVNFSFPQGWPIINNSKGAIKLAAGAEHYIPVRLSVPKDVVGGISYIFSGIAKVNESFVYANSYIYVRSESKWGMFLDRNMLYINEFKSREQFGVKLSNTGNREELIKLAFDVGNMLSIAELGRADTVRYISVPAYTDTTLRFTVSPNADLGYAEKQTSQNSWKEYSVLLKASTPSQEFSSSLRVKQLQSCETITRRTQASPLNFEVVLYNLMSSQSLKMNNKLYGSVLFKQNRSLSYSFNLNNIFFDLERNDDFSFDQNMRFLLSYYSKNFNATAGDNIGGGSLHSINGRGVNLMMRVRKKNLVRLTAVQNPISHTRGFSIDYSRNLGPINTNLGFIYDDDDDNKDYSAYSISPGIGFRFLKYNTANAQLVFSNVSYSNLQLANTDTSLVGFGYRLYYRFNAKKFRLQFSNLNSYSNYLRNSGVQRYKIDAHYIINEKSRIFTYLERNAYTSTRYPYNFYYPANTNRNDHGRMLFSYNKGNTIYQAGPQYLAANRLFHDTYSGFYTEYTDITPGVYGSMTYKISSLRSITPNIAMNNLNFKFSTNDTLFDDYSVNNRWFYSFGLNYYDYTWRINVYYTSGSTSDLYKSVLTEEEPSVSQAFHFRPSYERYFRDNTIRVSGYANFSYYTPSGRENFVFNLSSDFQLKNSWQLFASFNLFSTARVDDELGRISNRNFNTIVGVRKSFDIQQPRLKYYDIVVNCFNDLNGNNQRDAQEKPISNILITITRSTSDSIKAKVAFPQTELLTDADGKICYNNMPEGTYYLELNPLFNLENMFFLDGDKQLLIVDSKKEFQLPLVESFKIKGSIMVERDPNSTEGKITLEGIKITALSEDGFTYSTLTDRFGAYILNLPHDKTYKVSMSNVFNENFVIEQQEYTVRFGRSRSLKIDFKVHERRRAIEFDEDENFFDFKGLNR